MPKQNPLEKANELVDRFKSFTKYYGDEPESNAIRCALICVQEVIDSTPIDQHTYQLYALTMIELKKMF